MKIESLFIEKYRGIENLKIEFETPVLNEKYFGNLKISILVGENGVGKTTIFKLLTFAFCPNINVNDEPLIFNVNYKIGGDYYSVSDTGENIGDINLRYPRKILVSTFSVFDQFIIPRRVIREPAEKKNYNAQYIYCGPLMGNNSSSLMSIISIILKTLLKSREHNERYEAYIKMMNIIGYGEIKLLELTSMMDFSGMRSSSEDLNEIDKAKWEERRALRKELRRRQFRGRRPSRKGNFLVNIEELDENLFNKVLELIEDDHCPIRDLWMIKGNSEVPLSRMSSGELTMLFRFFPLITEIDHDSLILIDEPETHLHPAWVQKYIYYLAEIFSGFRVHVMLATHSPLIAADVPCECLVGLERNKMNQIRQYGIDNKTLGGDPKSILKRVFGLKHSNGVFTSEIMNKIIKLIDTEERNVARNMYHDLSTSREKYELFLKIEDKWE